MVAIGLNVLVVVLEVWAIGTSILLNGMPNNFVFYTQCSNLLGAVACALCLVGEVRALRKGQELGRAFRWTKYAASCCLLMTFVVVVAVLAPMLESAGEPGYYLMFFYSSRFVTHLAAPLLTIVSYILFEADRGMTLRQSLVGLVPTIAYSAVAYPCNVARLWDGPYPFLQVWNMPLWMTILWFVVLLVMAFTMCQALRLAARACGRLRTRGTSEEYPRG